MSNKKIVIFGGGTVQHLSNHLALCAPAYGNTARYLASRCPHFLPKLDVDLRLTKMAGGTSLETNDDISSSIKEIVEDDTTKVVVMSAALCDWTPDVIETYKKDSIEDIEYFYDFSKNNRRFNTKEIEYLDIMTQPAPKLIAEIRKTRKDIFLVAFKTTCGATSDEQYIAAMNLCKKSSCNLVFSNDVLTRNNMIVTPEEARYHEGQDRNHCLDMLLEMVNYRTHLTFTRSTIVDGTPIAWNDAQIPTSLREVVNYCIGSNAYKPFNGVTTGHFAFKVNDNTFLTSIRRTNFNEIDKNGMVKITTDGPDTVLAYGAKPSVGGQSQRIVFRDHPGLDCIVHFHCPKRENSQVPTVSQREFECGSHECGQNTSNGLRKFGNLYAVYLDNHGPNIVFNKDVKAEEVINFIQNNFDLSKKTGGFLSITSKGMSNGFPKPLLNDYATMLGS